MRSTLAALLLLATLLLGIFTDALLARADENVVDDDDDENEGEVEEEAVEERRRSLEELREVVTQRPPELPWEMSDAQLETFRKGSQDCLTRPRECINAVLDQASTPIKESKETEDLMRLRRADIKHEFMHAWNAYVKYAWGADELLPVTQEPEFTYGGVAATIFASLDTLMIMGLDDPLELAKSHLNRIKFDAKTNRIHVLDYVNQILAGLLSAHDLSEESEYLTLAQRAAEPLLVAYEGVSTTSVPKSHAVFAKNEAMFHLEENRIMFPESVTISQATAGLLEFTRLFQVTETETDLFGRVAKQLLNLIAHFDAQSQQYFDGLFSVNILHNATMTPVYSYATLGRQGMPYFSQLLREIILSDSDSVLSLYPHFIRIVEAVAKHLLIKSPHTGITFISEVYGYPFIFFPKMDLPVCALPGLLALDGVPYHLELSQVLMKSCLKIYDAFNAKFAPQMFVFNITKEKTAMDPYSYPGYDLSSDIFESLFVLYRVTGDDFYREEGWRLYQELKDRARLDEGYAQIRDVVVKYEKQNANRCEAHVFSSTFKYLYLLFAPRDFLPLNEYVFSYRGHPFRRAHISQNQNVKVDL